MLPAAGIHQVNDALVNATGDVEGAGRQVELLDAAAEEPADQLPTWLEQG
jgi:hypothetical protein